MDNYILSFIVSFIICFLVGLIYIKFLKKRKLSQTILEYVEVHNSKQGTPTMGGVMFLISTLATCMIFCVNENFITFLCLVCTLGFGVIGFLDDYIKIKFKRNLGLTVFQKIFGLGGLAIIIGLICYFSSDVLPTFLPFTFLNINLGIFIIPIVIFVIIAITNAVNLIDGLDGLCSKVSLVYLLAFSFILYYFSEQLFNLGYAEISIQEIKNLSLACTIFAGSLLAFLSFNSHKASVFMGDVGSLAIGGFIGCAGVFSGLWLYIPFLGLLYVITVVSVVIQVLYFKKTGKRVLLMAPIHHHFEKKGYNEEKIVNSYSILSILITALCIYFSI